MSTIERVIAENLQCVRQEIAEACHVAGRSPTDVKLVAVTKYAQPEWVKALSVLHHAFGENRPQQLADRAPEFPDIEWHLIGQLQRNKAKLALRHASVIHSVDSLKLLERLVSNIAEAPEPPSLLLQVNVTGEESKSGFSPAELRDIWPKVLESGYGKHIHGMMTMAAASDNPDSARPAFSELRSLRDALLRDDSMQKAQCCLSELSMGMSGDFTAAIAEGATMVRIGSRLYEGLS